MFIAYLDCFSGISGDMCLGALVDAGVPLEFIEEELKKIELRGYRISTEEVTRSGIRGKKVSVEITGPDTERKYDDIKGLIQASELKAEIKEKALVVFENIFRAEAKVHGRPFREVHLHELSATDCIVDILGTLIGLNYLEVTEVQASAVNLGSGTVKTAHGILPVPAPATAELLRGIPVYGDSSGIELTTPTGAAILKTLSTHFGEIPEMTILKTGYGAGNKELKGRANLLRLLIGKRLSSTCGERVVEIETNIDDMNPQICEYLMERLYGQGALEVFFTQIVMKKSRPGFKVTVLSPVERFPLMRDILFRESSTIGIRFRELSRSCLERKIVKLKTEFGEVRFKVAHYDEHSKVIPEFEDCKRIASERGLSLVDVMERLKNIGQQMLK